VNQSTVDAGDALSRRRSFHNYNIIGWPYEINARGRRIILIRLEFLFDLFYWTLLVFIWLRYTRNTRRYLTLDIKHTTKTKINQRTIRKLGPYGFASRSRMCLQSEVLHRYRNCADTGTAPTSPCPRTDVQTQT